MSEDNKKNARSRELPTLGSMPHCPDCGVAVGNAHISDRRGGCDVARCLVTGRQRLSCEADHDCGQDVWSDWWPGEADCESFGWMLGPGAPDILRLYTEAVWDPEQGRWVKPI
jgi:hypothetical protein